MYSTLSSTQLVSMNRQRERQKLMDAESRIRAHLDGRLDQLMISPPRSRDVSDSKSRLKTGPLKTEWDLYYSEAWRKMRKCGLDARKIASSTRPVGEIVDVPSVIPVLPTPASVVPVRATPVARDERRWDQCDGPFYREEFDEYYTDPLVAQQMWDCGIVYSTEQPFEEVVVCIPNGTPKEKFDQFGTGDVRWSEESHKYYHGNLMKSGCRTGAIPNGKVGWNLDRGVPQFNAGNKFLGASQETITGEIRGICTNHQVHGWCPLSSSRSEDDISTGCKIKLLHYLNHYLHSSPLEM